MSKPVVYNQLAGQRVQRIEALSDGVFAIAMTLLVLDLKVPVANALQSEKELLKELLALGPKIATYFVGFMTMGIFWVGQSAQLTYIEKTDRRLTWLSVFFLAFVSLLPFTTAYLSEHLQSKVAIGLYWVNIFMLGFILYIHWHCAYGSGLVSAKGEQGAAVSRAMLRRIVHAQLLYAGGALIGIIFPVVSVGFIFLVQLNYATAYTTFIKNLFRKGRNNNITTTPH
ncbi:TMEM175 family protein [Chitinophaga eiseniae]|uniref:DUF1211 domain-containing protein n=1 Tax=Chitinophaga eiseniae TaxID=634771 RepID=A0A847SUZ8_9BACT|nr:TMEM175 family protein [Chitinophaga eiseniae]NLR81609.1 DUF1211 domain-containing protein [Chitinophaga eiseniae]